MWTLLRLVQEPPPDSDVFVFPYVGNGLTRAIGRATARLTKNATAPPRAFTLSVLRHTSSKYRVPSVGAICSADHSPDLGLGLPSLR